MRVRLNFTLEVDVDNFNEAMGTERDKVAVRNAIQEQCIKSTILFFQGKGVDISLMGRNNVYDPKQKLTVAEHLVKS